ncbi:unnamed protein product, partial [Staurois parvus]
MIPYCPVDPMSCQSAPVSKWSVHPWPRYKSLVAAIT